MSLHAEIPYGLYWSTPFAKWQGAFADLHSVRFAAHVAKEELARREVPLEAFDAGVAPPVRLEATHISALEHIRLSDLKTLAL